MIVVMQCAGRKNDGAGYLTTKSGARVAFVGNPLSAPAKQNLVYARPDDISDRSGSWRDLVIDYNNHPSNNPLCLLPAFKLYANSVYRDLADKVGVENVFILSAGWGLIPANFLTPYYDITFSPSAENYVRRRKNDAYNDFCLLPTDTTEPILFFGSKEYLPLFSFLTREIKCEKVVFYNSIQAPLAPGCILRRFRTTTRTNWQYECARAFLTGTLEDYCPNSQT